MRHPFLQVKSAGKKGRGIFARKYIPKGTVIEIAPVIILPEEEVTEGTVMSDYVFDWTKDTSALALGYGSLFNHSYEENVGYEIDVKKKVIKFTTLRDIEVGDELTIDYGYDPVGLGTRIL